jgi:hypothetical protein
LKPRGLVIGISSGSNSCNVIRAVRHAKSLGVESIGLTGYDGGQLIVAGHVSLQIEGFDRIYLNRWVPGLQTSGQLAWWLGWRGYPIASSAALGKFRQRFRQAVRRYADGNAIQWVTFRKGDRKLDVMRPYLDAIDRTIAARLERAA